MVQTRFEYQVLYQQWRLQPDEKASQKLCDEAAAEGWRLVTATAATGSGGGKTLLFFEREAR